MKKRGLWIVAALGLIALVLVLLPPSAPFDFLAGRHPVDTSNDPRNVSRYGYDYRCYEFKTDFEPFNQEVWRELRALGYTSRDNGRPSTGAIDVFTYKKGDPRLWMAMASVRPGGKPEPGSGAVMVVKGRRHRNNAVAPGWVTVTVYRPKTESVVAKIRSWVGL